MVLVMLGGIAFPHFPKPGWHSNEYQNRRRVFLETEWWVAALTKLLPSASALFNRARNERASAFGPAGLGRRVIGEDADFTCFAYAPAVLARRQLKPFFYLSADDKIQIRASEAKAGVLLWGFSAGSSKLSSASLLIFVARAIASAARGAREPRPPPPRGGRTL